ncbi:hypothetical protein FRB99_007426 [Tulasnella sp. 403]|nr:hypothetical protein FRB99_007426 [Tulasnella sp. 403]
MSSTHLANGTTQPDYPIRINKPVPGVEGYFPLNEPKIGTPGFPKDVARNDHIPKLFTPIKIRDVEFKNRIFVSPMCQYSADDGSLTDWHFVHLGGFATRGAGAITVEATAVSPEGRISPEDSGLWKDAQIAPLKRIVNFAHAQGTHIGIQLAHAGRKASTCAPWLRYNINLTHRDGNPYHVATVEENGWPDEVVGPSDVPFSEYFPQPKALTVQGIEEIKQKFLDAIERCKEIGFDFIELHFAHGYLASSFLSPLSNTRTDKYGGSLENRARFPLELATAARKTWGEEKPLFVRVSATEWAEQGEKDAEGNWISWGIEQTRWLAKELKKVGVDLIDASSGGNWDKQKIDLRPGYQVPFAEAIKKDGNTVGAVGLITDPEQAEEILQKDQADVILLARELLRRADWPLYAAEKLGVVVNPASQYQPAWGRMLRPGHKKP